MDLHHLKLFHIVAKNLSFSKTAEELHISQPAISIQIKNLEEELGLRLIERHGRTVFLTRDGNLLYEYTKRIFSIIDEMEENISFTKGRISGQIRIGASSAPGVYILPKIMGMFKRRYPEVILSLYIGSALEIHNKLLHDELDFALIGGEVSFPKTFTVEKLAEDTMVMIVSPYNIISSYQLIDPKILVNQHYIAHDESSQLYKSLKKIITDLKLPFNVIMNLGSVDAIKHAVAENLGISIIPYVSVYEDIEKGMLKRVFIRNKSWKYTYSLVYYNKKAISPPVHIMIELVKNQINRIVNR